MLDAMRRIVTAECQASGCPKDPDFELFDRFPLTDNDPVTTDRVAAAFSEFFGDRAGPHGPSNRQRGLQRHPDRTRRALHLLGHRRHRRTAYRSAEAAGRVAQDIPVNHSPNFAPVLQPTLDTGTQALVVAALAWLAR